MTGESAREHGAAADEDTGNVESCRRHEQTGDVLVAVGNHDESVKRVSESH